MRKSVVVIESNYAGYGALALQEARAQGYEAAFLTATPDLYRHFPVDPRNFADTCLHADTKDPAAIIEALDSKNVCAILCFDDYHVVAASLAANAMGLPAPGLMALTRCRYKNLARAATNAANIEGANPVEYASWQLSQLTEEPPIALPCIVKPANESASDGVSKCVTAQDYQQAVALLRDFAEERGIDPEKMPVVVESFVEGSEFSAEMLWNVQTQAWEFLGATRKFVSAPPQRIELAHVFPYDLSSHGLSAAAVEKTVAGWLGATGLSHCAAHVEFILNDHGLHLVEINPRLGGDHIAELIGHAMGRSVFSRLIEMQTEDAITTTDDVASQVCAIIYLRQIRSGRLTEIRVPTDANVTILSRDIPSLPLDHVVQNSVRDRHGHIIGAASTPDHILEYVQRVLSDTGYIYGS